MESDSKTNAWLLPDGIDDVLPAEAGRGELLRRRLLDLYARWGYQLVIPPLIEFTDSLLVGAGADLDLQTFKMTDRTSGKTLGVRADITPQISRIDAHSLLRSGVSRYCYAGSVLRTKSENPLEGRAPIQVGVELYGEASVAGDIEVVALLIETLRAAGLEEITLDLGHVAILRSVLAQAGLRGADAEQAAAILRRKATDELECWLTARAVAPADRRSILSLAEMAGDVDVLSQAERKFGSVAGVAGAIGELEQIVVAVRTRYPGIHLHVDLAEIPGFAYHTGPVFAGYVPGCGRMIANGGRYDDVGAKYGSARPATGFNADLKSLNRYGVLQTVQTAAIAYRDAADGEQWQMVSELRQAGERVVQILGDNDGAAECDRELVKVEGQWQVRPLSHS